MSPQKFRGKIEAIGPRGSWSQMKIPFSVEKEWGSRARVSVKGKINGFEFRTSIFPDGDGGHTIMINKAMQQGAKAAPGDSVQMELQPDTGSRDIPAPADLKRALVKNAKANAAFTSLAPSHRNEFIMWIEDAKKPETRAVRIAKAVTLITQKRRQR